MPIFHPDRATPGCRRSRENKQINHPFLCTPHRNDGMGETLAYDATNNHHQRDASCVGTEQGVEVRASGEELAHISG